MPEHVMVFVDGPNADNQACAWGALNSFDTDEIKLGGVVVSATAVNYAKNAPLGSRDIALSRRVHALHTARMAGLFARAEVDVPVFLGEDIENTDITSPIPHSAHVWHDDYDIFGDAHGLGREAIAGDFNAALRYMQQLEGRSHIVIGGPFTEIPRLLEHSRIAKKLGCLAGQSSFSLSERAIYSKLAFNVDADMPAALKTLLYYPNDMINVPSDITRHPDVTYTSAEELLRMGVHPEIGEIFLRHRARAEERHKEEQRRREAEGREFKAYPALSIHDLQAVMALRQALGMEQNMFTLAPINVGKAVLNMIKASELREPDGFAPTITPHIVRSLGYVGGNQTIHGEIAPRYEVAAQNSIMYKQRVPELLRPRG